MPWSRPLRPLVRPGEILARPRVVPVGPHCGISLLLHTVSNYMPSILADMVMDHQGPVSLCQLLLASHDMILLDEPTNHLDAESIEWLEQFLAEYKGTVVSITHGAYFLSILLSVYNYCLCIYLRVEWSGNGCRCTML